MSAPRPLYPSETHNSHLALVTLVFITISLISLITLLALSADPDEIITLLVLGGLFLVPIVNFYIAEIKFANNKCT